MMIVLICILALFCCANIAGNRFKKREAAAKAVAPGNAACFDVDRVERCIDSPLKGKRILFLGSSVTYGSAAQGVSFADYLGHIHGIRVRKETVSSTTLVDSFSLMAFLSEGNGNSYVSRLKKIDTAAAFDAVVVQLSTNDATLGKPLGEISDSTERNAFDTKTVTGAIEYIIAYCKEVWDCPVMFYTGSYYESEAYCAMVDRLREIQEKWSIGVIDLYNDEELNNIDAETYDCYMYDKIHPTKAGYLKWWLPAIQEYMYEYLGE